MRVIKFSEIVIMAESAFGMYLVKKRNTKSNVWQNFALMATEDGKIVEKEQDKPICRSCGKGVLAKGSNTTNLFQHLREHHPLVFAELAPPQSSKSKSTAEAEPSSKQATLAETISRSAKYLSDSAQAKELNRAVTYYIAKDSIPISTVEKPGFKHLISKLNPRYQIPSRRHFADFEIPRLYSHVKDNIVAASLKNANFFAATTDFWTSGTCHPYLTLTVHFVNPEWGLSSFSLDTSALYEDHTGENIACAITDILDNWNLSFKKLIATTTDNGSNIVAAFRTLDSLRISCFGHNLDLAIKKGLNNTHVQRAISRCHSLVELFHRSWKKSRDLREKQQILGLPQHTLMGDVVTRWGSTFDMISRILEQQQALSAVLAEDRKNWHRMINDTELSVLETVSDILKPLSYLTDALACEKQITASAVYPVLKHVKKKLTVDDTQDTALAMQIKQTIWTDLENRYTDPDVVEALGIASFLDPRFKDRHLHDKKEIMECVTEQCLQYYRTVMSSDSDSVGETSVSPDEQDPIPAKRMKGLAAVIQHIIDDSEDNTSGMPSLTPLQKIEKEISAYLEYPSLEADANPLAWWKAENGRFPSLAYLAKKYLCICGTSVPSERIFSSAGHISNSLRNRLLPENVSKLVFLANNMPKTT